MFWLLIGCVHMGIPMPGKVSRFSEGYGPFGKPLVENTMPIQQPETSSKGMEIAEVAEGLIGMSELTVNGESFRYDCSGFVLAVHSLADVQLEGNTSTLYDMAKAQDKLMTTPKIGAMVFFDNTYDRNRNKQLDDFLTHIAIVTSIEEDGTVYMAHLGGSGITRLVMNPSHPDVHKSPEGKLWNSYLRINRKGEDSPRLTGQLFKVYASEVVQPSS